MDRRRTPFLPPRWVKCPRVGSMLLDLFIPCKTPLDSKFSQIIEPEDSSRFYHRREIENHGCKYVKIACKGNEETPTLEQVKLFISLVNQFEEKEAGEGKKIGVHCTHGFNRTVTTTSLFICLPSAPVVPIFRLTVDHIIEKEIQPTGIPDDDGMVADYMREFGYMTSEEPQSDFTGAPSMSSSSGGYTEMAESWDSSNVSARLVLREELCVHCVSDCGVTFKRITPEGCNSTRRPETLCK
ncbi:unnamed protein product [Dibothriocephalus latus]|uniref:Tyrosine specific protein phosphatases domain-containing protein n=1 Tax=Dibothriocephalus latus TaxID=60516 RepID=A0A3P7P3N5_DIBLA|nr:unnamed protein product [Dibothriocephalus latus]